jgi:SAM-dependent methyltransferase
VRRLLKTDLFNEGISPGLYPMLRSAADQVYGIDLSVETARAARGKYPALGASAADVRRLPFADGTFDLIVSNSTLDHFDTAADLPASLSELHRVLAVGGWLLLSLDNLANPLIAIRNRAPGALRRLGLIPYFVGATYRPAQLNRALVEAGFAVEATAAAMHCPRVLAVAGSSMIEKTLGSRSQERWLRALGAFESFSRLPTRFLTGHFITAKARKVHA